MKESNNFRNNIIYEIKELIKYHDLGFILNHIDDFINLPIPYKNQKTTYEEYEKNKTLAVETNQKAKQVYNELVAEVNIRKSTFNYIKSINPNFCENMRNKFPMEDYEEYLYLLKKYSKDITTLVTSFKDRGSDYRKLLLNRKDVISSIIDSEESSRLTYLQDMFVLQELNSTDGLDIDSKVQENISNIKQQLTDRIANYKKFEKLYSSKNIIRIKPGNNIKSEERE